MKQIRLYLSDICLDLAMRLAGDCWSNNTLVQFCILTKSVKDDLRNGN